MSGEHRREDPGSPFRQPRWTWFDSLLFGPNWGPLTPILASLGVFVPVWMLSLVVRGIAGALGWSSQVGSTMNAAAGATLAISLAVPLLWVLFRGMVRGHYRARQRAMGVGRCPQCNYDTRATDFPRCPECGEWLEHARFLAGWWVSRL